MGGSLAVRAPKTRNGSEPFPPRPLRDGQQLINPIGGHSNKRFVTHGRQSMSEFDSSSAAFDPPALITSRDLIVLAERPEGRPAGEPQKAAANKLFSSRFGVAAAALAIVAAVAGALFVEDSQQAKALAEQASENAALAHTVKSLEARLDAIDSATSNAGLADLRQSVGEIRSSLVSTREFSGALAQLSQRVDKLDHEASARCSTSSRLGFRLAWTSSSRRSPRLHQRRRKPHRPSSRRSVRNSTTSRWTGPVRSNGRDRFCADTSCSTLAMTSRSSGGAMANVKCGRVIISRARDASSASNSEVTDGLSRRAQV